MLNEIFSGNTGSCLSRELMVGYLRNALSASEKRSVDLHITDCELCSDAMDGLELLEKSGKSDAFLDEVSKKLSDPEFIRKKRKQNNKIIPISSITAKFSFRRYRYAAVAASIVFILGISVFYFLTEQEPQQQYSEQIEDDSDLSAPEKETVADDTTDMKNKIPSSDTKVCNPDSAANYRLQSKSEEATGKDVSKLRKTGPAKIITIPEKQVLPVAGVRSTSDTLLPVDIAMADELPQGEYEEKSVAGEGKYRTKSAAATPSLSRVAPAAQEFSTTSEKAVETVPESPEERFKSAMNYYEKGDWKNADKIFDEFFADKENKFYEPALWHKAQCLIKQDKRLQAIPLLEELSHRKGEYGEKAKIFLEGK